MERDLVLLVHQFLHEENYTGALHDLERESGLFFDMTYFEQCINNGRWEEAEKYLSGFTQLDDNPDSTKTFFEIRKRKYLEELERGDYDKAVKILEKDLMAFTKADEEISKDLSNLKDTREIMQRLHCGDTLASRNSIFEKVHKYIKKNPVFRGKLQLPPLTKSRLKTIINQGFSRANADMKTIFVDHSCEPLVSAHIEFPTTNHVMGASRRCSNSLPTLATSPLMGDVPKVSDFPLVDTPGPTPASYSAYPLSWRASVPHQAFSAELARLASSGADSENKPKKLRPWGASDEKPIIRTLGASSSTVGTIMVVVKESVTNVPEVSQNGVARTFLNTKAPFTDESEKPKRLPSIINPSSKKLPHIIRPSQLRSLRLPDFLPPSKVVCLVYPSEGSEILALAADAIHKVWRWKKNKENLSGKASSIVAPILWQSANGTLMTNILSGGNQEDSVPCFAVTKNDGYLASTSGDMVTLFNLRACEKIATFMGAPPAVTTITFHSKNYNRLILGRDDGSIQFYNIHSDQVIRRLKGHQKRVTGLAISNALNVLVSLGDDAQICVWIMGEWHKQAREFLQIPDEQVSFAGAHTRVQFHSDEKHVLVVHPTQLAIYEASNLVLFNQWFPLESTGPITDAVYSCYGHSICTAFRDGSVSILTGLSLQVKCRISPSAYLPDYICSTNVYPTVLAAHPSEPSQFALGLSDGGVHVIEPPNDYDWGFPSSLENDAGSSSSSSGSTSD